jgi:hypothetical protein
MKLNSGAFTALRHTYLPDLYMTRRGFPKNEVEELEHVAPLRSRRLLAVCALALAVVAQALVPSPAEATPNPSYGFTEQSHYDLAPGETKGGYTACHVGYQALVGSVTANDVWVQSASATPFANDGSSYFAAFYNPGLTAGSADVVVRCVPPSQLANAVVITKDLFDPNLGGEGGDYVSCPVGTQIYAGGAYWRYPGGLPAILTQGNGKYNRVVASTPTFDGNGWYAAGIHETGSGVVLTLVARCLAIGALQNVSLSTLRVTTHRNGSQPVGATVFCPTGTQALSGGVFFTDEDGLVPNYGDFRMSASIGNGWRVDGSVLQGGAESIPKTVEMWLDVRCVPIGLPQTNKQ